MKKTIAFILIALCIACAFAIERKDEGPYKGVTDYAFSPAYSKHYDGLNYRLFSNAADLAQRRFSIQLPDLAILSYNFSEAVKDRGVAEALSNLTKLKFSKNDLITYALGLVMATGSGFNDVFRVDTGLGAQLGNFGFGVNIAAGVKSMPHIDDQGKLEEAGSPAGNGFVPQLDIAFTFAYGRRIVDTDKITVDAGAALHVSERVYMLQISTEQISDLIRGGRDFENLPARGGFGFPIDLGVTVGLAGGHVKFNASAQNLNGLYYMGSYENSLKAMLLFKGRTDPYIMYTPFSINASVVMDTDLVSVNPELYLGFNGINLYIQNFKGMASPKRELFRYLDMGLNVKIFKALSLRASYSRGYPSVGAAFSLYGNAFELTYSFHEAGSEYGLRPVDCLTLRVKLGFEK